ncbi:MAG: site-specific integrase [Arenicellales bacterium]|jgi:integrase|nr:site-specific integrase [Arenicellales bacterium]
MATIRKFRGKFNVQIRRQGYPSVSRTFTSLATAKRWGSTTEADMERNLHVVLPDKTTTRELLDRYEEDVSPQHKSHQVEKYRLKTLKRYLGDQRVSALSPALVCKYRDIRLKVVSPASLKRELVILSSVLNTAIKEWGINLQQNPVSLVSLPKVGRGRDRRLEQGEEEQLLSASGELKRIIIVALETGMRRGEILNIKKSHIDFVRQTLLIPLTKTDTPRTIPLSSRAIEAIREQLRGSQNVIPIEETALFSYTARGLSGAFLRLCRKHGLENLHFHDLRHEATSRFFEKGLNPVEVATITGHKDTRMLMRYTHLRAEDLVKRLG